MPGPPEILSTYGFKNAPVSQILVMSFGATSVTLALLPGHYRTLLQLSWSDVLLKKQIYRLVTSQFITDNYYDSLRSCFLLYHFLGIERRFGSAKFASFAIFSWSVTMGLYFLVMNSNLFLDYVNGIEAVPSGLYGPLFAMLVYYLCDFPNGLSADVVSLPAAKNLFVFLVSVQLFLSSRRAMLLSSCGIIAGILHKVNFCKVQSWFRLPSFVSRGFDYLKSSVTGGKRPEFRSALMGATEEIQNDMVFDYYLQRQANLGSEINLQSRARVGQGYAEVIAPGFDPIFRPLSEPFVRPVQQRTSDVDQLLPIPRDPESTSSEFPPTLDEKVQALVDMGFARDSVMQALASTDNDLQAATNILLSASAQS